VQRQLLGGEIEVAVFRVADVEPARTVAKLGEILGWPLGHASIRVTYEKPGGHAARIGA